MTFTVMITTHDRCTDLRRTCAALTALAPPPDEVLICADGCADDTVSMVVREFPGFVLLADAIAEIVEDRDKRARMSIAARERARAYTWERYRERLVGALRSLRTVDEASTNELSKTHVIPGCSKAKSRRDKS